MAGSSSGGVSPLISGSLVYLMPAGVAPLVKDPQHFLRRVASSVTSFHSFQGVVTGLDEKRFRLGVNWGYRKTSDPDHFFARNVAKAPVPVGEGLDRETYARLSSIPYVGCLQAMGFMQRSQGLPPALITTSLLNLAHDLFGIPLYLLGQDVEEIAKDATQLARDNGFPDTFDKNWLAAWAVNTTQNQ